MKYRTLGRTGLDVSVVGLGTWQFGGEWGKTFTHDDVVPMFRRAQELGINLVDTAECYGDHLSESLVGSALASLGSRDRWVVATKFGHKFHRPFQRTEPRSPDDVRLQVEASLGALQTDRIDLLQYHSWADSEFFDDDVLAVLRSLVDEGKVLHVGNSVGSNTNVKQVAAGPDRGLSFVQIVYNRLDTAPHETTFPVCLDQNLGVLARVPLASGYLSGKYKPGHAFDANEVRGKWHKPSDRDAKLERVATIYDEEYAKEVDPSTVSMSTWALAWCLRHPAVTSVIPGVKDVGQVESNAAAAELTADMKV